MYCVHSLGQFDIVVILWVSSSDHFQLLSIAYYIGLHDQECVIYFVKIKSPFSILGVPSTASKVGTGSQNSDKSVPTRKF